VLDRRTVRTRTVVGALTVLGIALVVASIAMVFLLRRSLTHNVRTNAAGTARLVAAQLEEGLAPAEIPSSRDDDEFILVSRAAGDVLYASEILREMAAPLADIPAGESESFELPIDDDPFLVVAEAASTTDGELTVLVGHTLDNVAESTEVVGVLLAGGVPILLVLVGAITWKVTGRSLAPVESIRAEVEAISSDELHRRVPVPETHDEVARLASTMNRMLGRLEEGQQRERRFVSDASHELRSPVAAIRQHAEVSLGHPESSSTEELARHVLSEGLRLERLVEDLLYLARGDETTAPHREVIDLDDLVFAEVARLKSVIDPTLDTRKVSAGRISGDRVRLSRLVKNLLENAGRHAYTVVDVSLTEDQDEVVLMVADDGPGIDPKDRERVFQRFVRLEEARDRASGGTGLGLAIVADVVRSHGGSARILDSASGGAAFEIRFPRYA